MVARLFKCRTVKEGSGRSISDFKGPVVCDGEIEFEGACRVEGWCLIQRDMGRQRPCWLRWNDRVQVLICELTGRSFS